MEKVNSTLKELAQELRSCQSILLATHLSPDPDAIGSVCALALILKSLGISVQLFFPEGLSRNMVGLVGDLSFTSQVPANNFSALVVLDCASAKRAGEELECLRKNVSKVINIDHHVSNDCWGDLNFIDSQAAATCQIVAMLAEYLGGEFSPQIANFLYAGLLDDTGKFTFSNTTSQSLKIAQRLVDAGAEPQVVGNHLYFSVPERILKFWSACLSQTQVLFDGALSLIVVRKSHLDKYGVTAKDTEGLIDEGRKIAGTIVAVVMRETEKGWKFSLRSKLEVLDVNKIAAVFDGGGHRAASGCTIKGEEEKVLNSMLEVIKEELLTIGAIGNN